MPDSSLLKRILKSLDAAVAVAHPGDGAIWFENAKFFSWFPPPQGDVDASIWARLRGADVKRAQEHIARKRAFTWETEVQPGARQVIVSVDLRLLEEDGAEPLILLQAHNISKQKEAEYMLDSYSKMAETNASEVRERGHALEVESKHKSQFLANMSHELRTPLNAIIGYTELILDNIYGEVPEKVRDVLQRLEKNGRHLLGLINEVLDVSKIEAGRLTLSLSDYSMGDIVRTVSNSLEGLAAEKGLVLKVAVPGDLPVGRGDERRLTQVLMNLVGNAIKFTEAGEVKIEVETSDEGFLVSVTDTGPGIAPVDQQHIFEEFRQIDSSSTRTKGGTGLGLSIAKRIVELHEGRIWVESKPGKGSTFSFVVPLGVSAA